MHELGLAFLVVSATLVEFSLRIDYLSKVDRIDRHLTIA